MKAKTTTSTGSGLVDLRKSHMQVQEAECEYGDEDIEEAVVACDLYRHLEEDGHDCRRPADKQRRRKVQGRQWHLDEPHRVMQHNPC